MCDKNPNWPLINCWLLLLSSFVFACKPKKRIWHTYVKSHGALNCTFICKGFYCGPEQLKKNNRNEVGGRSDSCGSKIQVVPKNYYNLYFFKPKAKLRYHHIIAIFVIISIIIIIIILAIMQLRPCEIETLLVSGCSLTLQAWQWISTYKFSWPICIHFLEE